MRSWASLLGILAIAVFSVAVHAQDYEHGHPEAFLTVTRFLTPAEIAARDTYAKFEPPVGCYLGAFIDFDGSLRRPIHDEPGSEHQDPASFEEITHRAHAMYFFYLGYGRRLPMNWVKWLGAHNKFVHIALEPNEGLGPVKDDAYLRTLADDMAKSGARIFLRFASEMNGEWTNYHKDPVRYRRAFRLVHDVMKRRAPNVAMVWCPYMSPIHNIKSYYPGDDAVDWVGINLYNVTYHNNSIAVPEAGEHPCDLLSYVYNRYARHKPIMICEYGATHNSAIEGNPRPDFAFRKILTLYNALPRLFPRVKCINYFDSNNLQFVAERAYNDYSVTDDYIVTAAYRNAVSTSYFLDVPNADAAPYIPPAPMPMRRGEELKGKATISCWARTGSDFVTVRYLVDGQTIYRADRPDLWECIWDAGSVTPGRHILTLQALNRSGGVTASQSLPIQTRP